jgi:hypothetical protein
LNELPEINPNRSKAWEGKQIITWTKCGPSFRCLVKNLWIFTGGGKVEWVKSESWTYQNIGEAFTVEIRKWKNTSGKIIWNKYLYLFSKNKHFGKYRPSEGLYPDVPFDFHCGITWYKETFDKDGNMISQGFGDDYNHLWDDDLQEDRKGKQVFEDAGILIGKVEE